MHFYHLSSNSENNIVEQRRNKNAEEVHFEHWRHQPTPDRLRWPSCFPSRIREQIWYGLYTLSCDAWPFYHAQSIFQEGLSRVHATSRVCGWKAFLADHGHEEQVNTNTTTTGTLLGRPELGNNAVVPPNAGHVELSKKKVSNGCVSL